MNLRLQHLVIVGAIAQMPQADRAKIETHAEALRTLCKDEHAKLALALVGSELAAEVEE